MRKYESQFKRLFVFFLALTSIFCKGQIVEGEEYEQIDSLLNSEFEKRSFQGAALVAKHGKIIYQNAFGESNMEWKTPNTISTKFQIGSVTKPFTALAVLKAVEEGLLDLNKRITDYLPDYPKTPGDKITIHHLLSHTSGIIDFPDIPGFEWNLERLGHSQEMMLAYFQDKELKFEPGTNFKYSNLGYYLLTVILEKVKRKEFAEILQTEIFDIARMDNTSVAKFRTILDQRAEGYANTGKEVINAPPWDQSIVKGSGDIVSTVEDLFLFSLSLFSNKLLSQKYMDVMFTPSLPTKDNYAYGWFVSLPDKHSGPKWVRHSGSINGFSAILTHLTDDNYTIVLLSNLHGVKTIKITEEIKKILYK
ncbi:serine hydrolase domain-containing protein [Poritiphilus flavus]|uniref:Serine hydrolase n=1 Tax=Poritiphilus flavus TaxID=2697053 RepID=A0A6L9E8N2_9FLAO|nr:serine hydrolase domain-containing protein [Poritiphilus flavus]NAS11137.1 serine hydrolase [Poritiphilus flavus]